MSTEEQTKSLAREYMLGVLDRRVELRTAKPRSEVVDLHPTKGLECVRKWREAKQTVRVFVDPLPSKKYYGSTVSAGNFETGETIVWTVWEHEPGDYASRPSDRWCDAWGLPHGIGLDEANNIALDAGLYDTHHESQFCYLVCYELAQLLRAEANPDALHG